MIVSYPIDTTPGVKKIIDYLGHHPVRPKEEIGLAMAKLGFRVPDIFGSYEQAIASGERFIARSEHPGELFYSGLGTSYRSWGPHAEEIAGVQRELQNPNRSARSFRELGGRARTGFMHSGLWHGRLARDYSQEFKDEVAKLHSLSYWRAIEGPNYYICADNGREERLYVGRCDKTQFWVVDDGEIDLGSSYGNKDEMPPVKKITEFYEQIRRAELFDKNVAHIVECADDGGEMVFLQAFPTQPYRKADSEVGTDQEAVKFVRGVTPENGVEFDIKRCKGEEIDYDGSPVSYSLHESDSQFEYMLPRTAAYFHRVPDGLSRTSFLRAFGRATSSHGGRGLLLKPPVFVALSGQAYDLLHNRMRTDVRAWVRSDGERATVRYYDPKEDEVVQL